MKQKQQNINRQYNNYTLSLGYAKHKITNVDSNYINMINWLDLRSILDKIQVASLNATGERELKQLMENLKERPVIIIKENKSIKINSNKELQDLIDTYDPNIQLSELE